MILDDVLTRLPRLRPFRAAQPSLACEIGEDHVVLVRLGGSVVKPHLDAFYVADTPAGSLKASAAASNVTDAPALARVLRAAREAIAPAGGPVALCLPDSVVRLAIIATDVVPRKRDDVRELIAWRLKKMLPFRMEEAHVDWQVFTGRDGKPGILALAARRRVVAEYEQLLASEGFDVGSVTACSLVLAERLPAGLAGDALLIDVGAGWFSLFITDGREPAFFRSKALPEHERSGAERDWFVAGEIFPTLEYYRSRLGRAGITRCFLHVSGAGRAALEQTLATAVDLPIEPLAIVPPTTLASDVASRLAPACALALRGLGEARRAPARAGAAGAAARREAAS